MKYNKIFVLIVIIVVFIFLPNFCRAMPPGTLLYRSTNDGKMFGYSGDPLIESSLGVVTGINPGHVAMYIGEEDGAHYVVEALSSGVVKTKLEHFVNEALGEKFLGAKIPKDLSPIRQAKAVMLARNLAQINLNYDFDFKKQKGPGSGEWTCVGLVEKIYESADIANPLNLSTLEYDVNKYAINITPDGFNNYSFYNREGDCFSRDKEFSMIAPRDDLFLPLAEEYGFNAGLVYQGDRYIFLPYTQFLQTSLREVVVDQKISSSFKAEDVRGKINVPALLLRWSLINNPLSALEIALENLKTGTEKIINNLKTTVVNASNKILGSKGSSDLVWFEEGDNEEKNDTKSDNTAKLTKISSVTVASSITSASENKSEKDNKGKEDDNQQAMILTAIKENLSSIISSSSPKVVLTDIDNKNNSNSNYLENIVNSPSQLEGQEANNFLVNNNINNNDKNSLEDKVQQNQVITEPIKISKVYTTLNNDFIELYNPNNFAVDLAASAYRLEKTKTGVDPSILIRIGNLNDGSYPGGTIIPARGYYLIVREGAASYYLDKAQAIAIRNDFSLTGLNQTIYLGTGAISSYYDEDIVDVLGFGPGASYYLGSAPALKIADYHFLNRISYQNNNSLDYNLLLSAEPAAIAAFIAENSTSLNEENNQQTEGTVNNTEENEQESEIIPADSQNNNEEDEVEENKTENNETENQERSYNELFGHIYPEILIKKIATYNQDDYIELFNYSNVDIDLAAANFRLEKAVTSLSPDILMRIGNDLDGSYPGGTIIPAGGSYLIVRAGADNRLIEKAQAIASRDSFSLLPSGRSIYLGVDAISSSSDKDIIDLVGYGPEALYYSGLGPAPAISDGYFLERISLTANNQTDFKLTFDEYYSSIIFENNSSDELFVFNEAQISEGIDYLWNFDNCYEDLGGKAMVGRWSCGRHFSDSFGNFNQSLEQEIDMNKFSLGFYYHPSEFWPRIDFSLSNDNYNFSLGIEPGYLIVSGIPGEGVFYLETEFENKWNYLTLVVDQVENYWAVYANGRELVKRYFLATLAKVNHLSLSAMGGGLFFEELSIWDRTLKADEINNIINNNKPFYPSEQRLAPAETKLLYHWDFDEYGASVLHDKIKNQELNVNNVIWQGRATNNYVLGFGASSLATANLSEEIISQDLSLSFWWRNSVYPGEGRISVELLENTGEENIEKFSLTTDYFRKIFNFNNSSFMMAEGIDNAIPYDDKWHHLALVYDSYLYKMKLYVDGENKAEKDIIRFQDGKEKINNLKIYSDSPTSAIDDLMIFSGALNNSQILEIYQNTKTEHWDYY